MEPKVILTGLEEVAHRVGLTVRYEKMDGDDMEVRSGRCRLKGEDILLVDRRLDIARRIDILVRELKQMDLGDMYIKPYLRAILGD